MGNIVYSVDQLLKDRPTRLKGLEIVCNEEPDNYSININKVNVFCRKYNIIYGEEYVIVEFQNKSGETVANVSAFGSNNNKGDEHLIVGYGEIISQTSARMMNRILNSKIN